MNESWQPMINIVSLRRRPPYRRSLIAKGGKSGHHREA
jgi:hypothetical protein